MSHRRSASVLVFVAGLLLPPLAPVAAAQDEQATRGEDLRMPPEIIKDLRFERLQPRVLRQLGLDPNHPVFRESVRLEKLSGHITMSFTGGTAKGYFDAVVAHNPYINIAYVEGDPESVRVGAIDLQSASIDQAVSLVRAANLDKDKKSIVADFEVTAFNERRLLVRILDEPSTPKFNFDLNTVESRVVSLREYLDCFPASQESALKELLGALDVAVATTDTIEGSPAANVRFHPDSALLFIHGRRDSVSMAEQAVERLIATATKSRRFESLKKNVVEVTDAILKTEEQIDALDAEHAKMSGAVVGAAGGVSQARRADVARMAAHLQRLRAGLGRLESIRDTLENEILWMGLGGRDHRSPLVPPPASGE
ncbi:MAG TPA: hypothetical protein VD971_08935 [Phycisphaerales bacterium]|nr:hypothetical protein [Phycisphaerales bacterium]